MSSQSSLQLGIAITGTKIGSSKFSDLQITPEYKMYLSSDDEAPEGFYAAPFIHY